MEGRGWCYVKTIENNYPGSNEHKVVDKRKVVVLYMLFLDLITK
jgi:hypothetical protein